MKTSPRLSDEDLVRVLELAGGSDSVELKLTIPAEHHRSTVADLGIDPDRRSAWSASSTHLT